MHASGTSRLPAGGSRHATVENTLPPIISASVEGVIGKPAFVDRRGLHTSMKHNLSGSGYAKCSRYARVLVA
jgi:hypothetical protein